MACVAGGSGDPDIISRNRTNVGKVEGLRTSVVDHVTGALNGYTAGLAVRVVKILEEVAKTADDSNLYGADPTKSTTMGGATDVKAKGEFGRSTT